MDAELLKAIMDFGGLGFVGFVAYWMLVRSQPAVEKRHREDFQQQEDRHRSDREQWVKDLNELHERHAAQLVELHDQTLARVEQFKADIIHAIGDAK